MAILEAAAALFAESGYEHLTIEGIARRAGVGKQTIYRWWSSKGDVIAEAILGEVVKEASSAARLARGEAGVITFFLALPIDLVISSGLHAGLMGIRFGKGIEVWFVQRLIQLSILAAIAFVAALVVLVQNLNG